MRLHVHHCQFIGDHLYATLILVGDGWQALGWEGYACLKSLAEVELNTADLAQTLSHLELDLDASPRATAERLISQAVSAAPTCRFEPDLCPWWYERRVDGWEVQV